MRKQPCQIFTSKLEPTDKLPRPANLKLEKYSRLILATPQCAELKPPYKLQYDTEKNLWEVYVFQGSWKSSIQETVSPYLMLQIYLI